MLGLKNKSRAPINKRKSKIKEEVKEYIRQYRTKYIGISKEVKYLQLKRYCKGKWIKGISEISVITREFISEKKEKVPFNIKSVQTDNGLECKKHFDKYI